MKREFCKSMSYVLTAALLLGIAIPSSPAAAKANAPKLSSKKISIKVGQKKTVKVKNTKKKIKWSIKSGKKNITLSNKKKTSVTSAPKATPTAPSNTDSKSTSTPSPTPSQPTVTEAPKAEAVKDVVIDMTKVGETSFTQSPAMINFSSQIEDRFDLSYFKELKVGYELEFEGEDTSLLTGGKIALANKVTQLN